MEPAPDQRRMVRFKLPLPERHEFPGNTTGTAKWERALRQRWRALALVIKAKLEAVESGITTFEEEFLAHIMLPDGETVGEWLHPQLEKAYSSKAMPTTLRLALPEKT